MRAEDLPRVEDDGPQAPLRQQAQGVHRGRARRRARREVEDALHEPLADALERRKERGHGLARARGRLRQDHALVPDGQIDLLRQLPLARAVGRKGEGQRAHFRGQRRPAAREPVQPGEVRPHIALELLRERLTRVRAHKARDFAVRQAEVRHADLERGQVLRLAEHVRVAFRLRPVQGRGLRRRAIERGLDLLHAAQAVHAVRAAEHRQAHGLALRAEAQRHLVAHALLLDALQALVPAHALEQALGRGAGRKVARPQRILHHRVHRSARRRLLQRSNPLFSDVEWV